MRLTVLLFLIAVAGLAQPGSWVDPDTGHRVVRLTQEPNSVLNLETHAAKPVVKGQVRIVVTGHKTQNVYYIRDEAVFATDVDTLVTKKIAALPARGSIATVNADETLLAGTYIEGEGKDYNQNRPQAPQQLDQPVSKGQMMEDRLAARLPMAMFTIDARTGEMKVIHRATDWLNHLEFNPSDPTLLMFCHEGPWHKVDRIWTMRTDGSQVQLIHKRTMAFEIAGHEFWSSDGKILWYDLQTPRGEVFWLEKLGMPGMLNEKDYVQPGTFHAEKLVNMSKHNYKLEPNVSFTPDQKWVVFRSNMFGATYAFAVEVEKHG